MICYYPLNSSETVVKQLANARLCVVHICELILGTIPTLECSTLPRWSHNSLYWRSIDVVNMREVCSCTMWHSRWIGSDVLLTDTKNEQSLVAVLREATATRGRRRGSQHRFQETRHEWNNMVKERVNRIEEVTSDLSSEGWIGVWPARNKKDLAMTEETAGKYIRTEICGCGKRWRTDIRHTCKAKEAIHHLP